MVLAAKQVAGCCVRDELCLCAQQRHCELLLRLHLSWRSPGFQDQESLISPPCGAGWEMTARKDGLSWGLSAALAGSSRTPEPCDPGSRPIAPEHGFQRHDGRRCAMKPSIRPSARDTGLNTIHLSIGKEEPLAWIIYNLRCFTLAFAAAIWLDWADAIIPAHCTKPTNSIIPPMPFCIASIARRYTAATGE